MAVDNTDYQAFWLNTARQILDVYALSDIQLAWLAHTHHVVLRVTAAPGDFILRLSRESVLSREALSGEIQWLKLIRQYTSLAVPHAVENNQGEAISTYDDADPIHAVLFRYLEGVSYPAEAFAPKQMQEVGVFLARLHELSSKHPDETAALRSLRPRLDWEGLFGAGSVYDPGDGASIFTAEQRNIFAQVGERIRSAMEDLAASPGAMGMIHADLLSKNILFRTGEVCALDFEYCGWGFYLYDLAPLLWQLRHRPGYAALEDAMWEGYTSARSLRVEERTLLETFIVARHLASCRWIAGNLDNPAVGPKARRILAERTREMQRFLLTGRLERASEVL